MVKLILGTERHILIMLEGFHYSLSYINLEVLDILVYLEGPSVTNRYVWDV